MDHDKKCQDILLYYSLYNRNTKLYIIDHSIMLGPAIALLSWISTFTIGKIIVNQIMFYNDYEGSGKFEGLAVLWEDGEKAEAAADCLNDRSPMHNVRSRCKVRYRLFFYQKAPSFSSFITQPNQVLNRI